MDASLCSLMYLGTGTWQHCFLNVFEASQSCFSFVILFCEQEFFLLIFFLLLLLLFHSSSLFTVRGRCGAVVPASAWALPDNAKQFFCLITTASVQWQTISQPASPSSSPCVPEQHQPRYIGWQAGTTRTKVRTFSHLREEERQNRTRKHLVHYVQHIISMYSIHTVWGALRWWYGMRFGPGKINIQKTI